MTARTDPTVVSAVRTLRAQRLSWAAIARAVRDMGLGTYPRASLWRLVSRDGPPMPRTPRAPDPALVTRDAAIVTRAATGESQASLAREYGLTRQRVHQILTKAARGG